VRLSELLGLPVRTESGHRLGVVHDVRAELRPRSLAVTGVVVGAAGLVERLGVGALLRRRPARGFVAWGDVVRTDRRGIVVRDGAGPSGDVSGRSGTAAG
jgi:sporulation protein YlmC with PRC-barrel domain